MMTNLSCDVIKALAGKTLVTAESCTGGGIGAALTSVPGSSEVFKGGIICYTNWVKENILEIEPGFPEATEITKKELDLTPLEDKIGNSKNKETDNENEEEE